jgi:hypothetical protein
LALGFFEGVLHCEDRGHFEGVFVGVHNSMCRSTTG